jgi:hypothetical protein
MKQVTVMGFSPGNGLVRRAFGAEHGHKGTSKQGGQGIPAGDVAGRLFAVHGDRMTVFEQEQFVGDRSMNVEDHPDLRTTREADAIQPSALAEYSVLGFRRKEIGQVCFLALGWCLTIVIPQQAA